MPTRLTIEEVATIEVPACHEFIPRKKMRAGVPGYLDIGQKFSGSIDDVSCHYVTPRTVKMFRSPEAVPEEFPPELGELPARRLEWWQIHYCLQFPSAMLTQRIPTGSQIGFLSAVPKLCVRAKVSWIAGHSLGLRPDSPGWTWNPGTFFAVGI